MATYIYVFAILEQYLYIKGIIQSQNIKHGLVSFITTLPAFKKNK